MSAVPLPPHSRRVPHTTPREVTDEIEARVASLESHLGVVRRRDDTDPTILPQPDRDPAAADVIARLRHLESRLALEDLDR